MTGCSGACENGSRKFRINRNSFRIIAGRTDKLSWSLGSFTITRMSSEPIQIALEHHKTVPEGSGSSSKGSGASQNHPGRSQNCREWPQRVLEGSGRFQKFLDSTIGAQTPLALGGKAPQGGWPKFEGWKPLRSSGLRFPSPVLDSGSP